MDEAGTRPIQSSTHSFIIRLRIEESGEEEGLITWRGYITHVPGGERRYLQSLDDISNFIATYLAATGARPMKKSFVAQWLRRLRRRFTRQG
jgi:hypothetical protein